MDLDLGQLRAFVTVADTAHFGRAADRLKLDQSAVSRRVQALERDLGVRLLNRTSRTVALTADGAAFLPDARAVLDTAESARRRLAGRQRLNVGFAPGLSPTPVMQWLRAEGFDRHVGMTQVTIFTQTQALLDSEVDVVLGRLPLEHDDIVTEVLGVEAVMVLLPRFHPLAAADAVSLADIAGEPMVRHPGPRAARLDAAWSIDPRPDGTPVTWGPVVRTLQEKLEYAAAGEALTLLPASCASFYAHPGVAVAEVIDAPPSTAVLAWCDDGRSKPFRDAFIAAARATLHQQPLTATA